MGNIFGYSKPKSDNLETFHLIWLDSRSIDAPEDKQGQELLRTSINHLRIFNDVNECEAYIHDVEKNDRIVFIVTGRLGEEILPRIHQLRQISSIYIFCMNKEYHEQWSNKFSKVRGVITDLEDLVAKIRLDQLTRTRNKVDEPVSISIFDPTIDSKQWTIGFNTHIIYSHFLIRFFLELPPNAKNKTDLVSLCKTEYFDNTAELAIVDEFQKVYASDRALWWYTRNSFLSRLLNKALRVQNTDLLLLFRFFISDINMQLQKRQCESIVHAYRSQLMSDEELDLFKNSVGKFISIDSFLSTISNRDQAIDFVKTLIPGNELRQTLFEIEANPQYSTTKPFANITAYSYSAQDEILFMAGSIFKLIDIQCDDNQIWIIRMQLSDENNEKLKPTFDLIKRIQGDDTNLMLFIYLLQRLGRNDEAEKYCLRLLDELPQNHPDLSGCCKMLGSLAHSKNDLEAGLKWYRKSLEYTVKNLPRSDSRLSNAYASLANAHQQKGDYKNALEFYNKALEITKEIFGAEHIHVAEHYSNMGAVCQVDKQWFSALDYYLKSLVIQQKQSLIKHGQLCQLLNNMADCHIALGLFDLGLKYYYLSIETFEASQALPTRNKAPILYSIGFAYEKKDNLEQALLNYQKSADIYSHAVSPTHPSFVKVTQDIERISSKLKKPIEPESTQSEENNT